MDNFCEKCGLPLDSQGNCPNCSQSAENFQKAENAHEHTAEVVYEPKQEPAYNTIDVEQTDQNPYSQPKINSNPQPVYTPPKPSKLSLTFVQVWNVIKCFFSKNTVDAISAQYNEKLSIWAILLPLYAILSAISMTLEFNSTGSFSIGTDSLLSNFSISSFDVFVIGLLFSGAVCFAYILGVVLYFKAFKIGTKFKSCANLTLSAYLPFMVVTLFNIITGGNGANSDSLLSILANSAFVILLYIGISRVMNNNKIFWSFFLMLICATLAAVIAGVIISLPVLITKVIFSAASSLQSYYF